MSVALLALGAAEVADVFCTTAFAEENNPYASKKPSWSDSISSGVKGGFGKIGKALSPKPSTGVSGDDDAVALKSKSKPGPSLYVAVARLYMQTNKLDDAEKQFQMALDEKRDFLPALLGYAELKERMNQPGSAIQLYQRAASVYPKEASVHNNMGLCFARQGRLDEAVSAMSQAIQLDPKNIRYQNNIATVLVDQGKLRDAFEHLRKVHGEATAYYNLGYLLNKKGQTQAAIQHFSLALQTDPSMIPARNWLEYLEKKTTQARLPQHPAAGALRITSDRIQPDRFRDSPSSGLDMPPNRSERASGLLPTRSGEEAQSLPEAPMPETPRRLPPVASHEAEPDGPSLPGISYDGDNRPSAPSAPLPPPATNSAVRHLPRVN
jgi:tetratricopeptide (TPR) repeat protein